jgi:hypothetical protein
VRGKYCCQSAPQAMGRCQSMMTPPCNCAFHVTSQFWPCPFLQDDQEQQGVKVHRVERSQSFVRRSLRLPEYADLSKVQVRAPCMGMH